MSDLTPPTDDPWPSQPSRPARQVHAVLAWLVVEADVPHDVHVHLVDALLAWVPLMGEHLFPTEPDGADADLRQVLEEMWRGLDAQAAEARWVDKVVLNEVRGRVGLAMQALWALRAPGPGLLGPRSPGR